MVRARSAEAASREGLTRAKAADHEFELNSGRRVEVRAFEVDKVFDTHMTELDDLADVGDVQEVFAQLFEVQPKRSDAAASVRRIEFFAPETHDQ